MRKTQKRELLRFGAAIVCIFSGKSTKNENFPLPVVEELRRLGHEVLTTHEAGEAGKSVPDEQVPASAIAESRALVTLNRKHFIHLHNAILIMPGS